LLKAKTFLALLFLLTACAVEPLPAPTQATQVGREQAVTAAEAGCNTGHSRQLEPPRLLEAHLMGRAQAEAILQGSGSPSDPPPLPPGGDPTPVWLVALEGRWTLYGGPPPLPTPTGQPPVPSSTPVVWTTCRVVIDAATGRALIVN
jgi:hypothetical protein